MKQLFQFPKKIAVCSATSHSLLIPSSGGSGMHGLTRTGNITFVNRIIFFLLAPFSEELVITVSQEVTLNYPFSSLIRSALINHTPRLRSLPTCLAHRIVDLAN